MGKLTLEALEIVDAIDRGGSFTAAGEALHKVPSTISYTVSKIEDDLQVALFRRNGPRIEITEAGRELSRGPVAAGRRTWSPGSSASHPAGRAASSSLWIR
jgi:hypothetical protein